MSSRCRNMRAQGLYILGVFLSLFVDSANGAVRDCITSCDDGPGFGTYNDCSACDGYFLCYGMFKYRMPCAPGTEFDSKRGSCVSESNTCAVNCEVSEWSDWSECPVTCGGATRTRSRDVTVPAENGGQKCPDLTETETCNDNPCPVDCVLSEWTDWSSCPVTCGGGTITRTRTVTVAAAHGGAECSIVLSETDACGQDPCPVNCVMNSWGSWGSCSKTCGTGTQTRSRSVQTQAANGGTACPATSESQSCNTQKCADISCPEAVIITDETRSMCYSTQQYKCDQNTGPEQGKWYRFVGEGGENLVIPEYPPPLYTCDTTIPGWLNSPHPTDYEAHERTVCYSWGYGYTCLRSVQIQTQRCDGYYIYKLYYYDGCYTRICTASMTHRGKPDAECL